MSHEPQDPRAKRGPAQIRNDPRARFKDSYAQFAKHLNQWLRQFPLDGTNGPDLCASEDIEDASHPARRELQRLLKRISDRAGLSDKDADIVKVETIFIERLKEREVELQRLKYEHHDADAKNTQLRNALRASASALQHAATLMPPDIGIDIQEDEYLNQIQELQRQVVDKDNRILELLKGTTNAQSLAARAEKTLQRALGKWAPSAIPVELQREAFQAWSAHTRSGEVRQRKQEAEFQKRLGRSSAALQSKINGIVGGLAHATIAQEARVALESWRRITKQGRFEKEKKKLKEEQVRKTVMQWASDFPKTAMPAIFFAWRRLIDSRHEEKKAEEMRREHMRLAKEEKRQRIASAALALTADPKKMDPYAMKVILRAWQYCMIEARAENAVRIAHVRAEEREKERRSQFQRRFAMLASEGNHGLLHGSFKAWHSEVLAEKEERKRQQTEQRLSYLQGVFRSWSTLTSVGKRAKELENEKERLQKEQDDLLREVEEHRRQNSKMRGSLLGLASEADPHQYVLLGMIMASWKELLIERRLLQSREEERKKVEQEFQERQEEQRISLRMRQSVMAFSAVDQKLKGQKEVLLPILWAAWRELVEENQRDQHMDITQRLYEEEAKKAQQEAQQLKVEASQLRQRHLHTQQKRQAVFLMSLEQRDQTLLLQVTMSAWRECVEDRRKHAVNEMRKQLQGLQGDTFMKVIRGPSTATDPAYPGASPPKKGLCQRMCRCLPFCCTKSGSTAVSQAPPAKTKTAPSQLPSAAADTGKLPDQPGGAEVASSREVVEQPGLPAQPPSELPAGSFIPEAPSEKGLSTLPEEPGDGLRRFEGAEGAAGAGPQAAAG